MPARSFGYAEVEERLQEIRRRLNSLVIQKALYAAASVALLGMALLVVVAVFGGGAAFHATLWLAGIALLATLGFSVRFVLRKLVSIEDAARFADRHARLQDRLATLHAYGRARAPSRLADLLLADALNFGPRWKASALGLRTVPRSIYLVILSAVMLGATAFLGPGDETEETKNAAAGSPDRQTAEPETEAPPPVRRVVLRSSGGDQGPLVGLGQVGDASDGAGEGEGQGSAPNDDLVPPGRSRSSKADQRSTSPGATALDAPSQLQHRIREALGRSQAGEQAGGEREPIGAKPPPDLPTVSDTRDRQAVARNEKSGNADDRREGAGKVPGANAQQATESARGQKSARDGEGEGGGELFGSELPAEAPPGTSQKFTLQLTGASNARLRLDPQGGGEETPVGVHAEGGDGPFEVPEQGVPDSTLQRAEISPEHEAILGRIFRRD